MADQSEREEPDHTEDPRRQQTGSGGYPETQQEGASPAEGTDVGPEGDAPT